VKVDSDTAANAQGFEGLTRGELMVGWDRAPICSLTLHWHRIAGTFLESLLLFERCLFGIGACSARQRGKQLANSMDINRRVAFQAFLGAVGGAVGTVIGGPTGLIIGLVAPSVLVEAAKHFPEPHLLIRELDNLPGLLWDGEMMHWVDSNISSMFWKLDNDFFDSPLPGRHAVVTAHPLAGIAHSG
jgi:hypothetical protein